MRSAIGAICLLTLAACSSPTGDSTTLAPTPETTTSAPPATSITEPHATTSTDGVSTTTTPDLAPLTGLEYEVVGSADFPIALVADGQRELLAVRGGTVTVLESGETVLDIADATRTDGERGLLGMAVGGDSGDLFVHYSASDGDTVVSSFERDGSGFDRDSETVLLRLDQPAANHNGGMIQFDGAGRLILGLGDGGGANDQFGHGQDFDTLLGGLVAIDPGTGDAELISGGLRNPWRFWIDEPTGTISVADVGQGSFEEVSIVPFDGTFHNFGWSIMEGMSCFQPRSGCDREGLTLPVLDIAHGDEGTCSITGGITYRGEAIPELSGQFFYSDLCGGWLRSVSVSEPHEVTDWTPDVGNAGQVVSFGTDRHGEIYVLTTSNILKVVPRR